MLETTECIGINSKGREYTDCMEFSLLRFLQLMLFSASQVSDQGSSSYPPKEDARLRDCSQDLLDYIHAHPTIEQSATHYNCSAEGKQERNDWAAFVSDRHFMEYYRNDRAELFTNISNIIRFYNGFFSLNLSIADHKASLNAIARHFSVEGGKQVEITLGATTSRQFNNTMEFYRAMVSRPDDEYASYCNNGQRYPAKLKNTILYIMVDEQEYEWHLYEVCFEPSSPFRNKFITGHSVIHKV